MGVTPLRSLAPERGRVTLVRRPASPLRVPEAPVADRATPTAIPPRPAWLRRMEPLPPGHAARLDAPEGERLDARLDATAREELDAQLDEPVGMELDEAAEGGAPEAGSAGARRGRAAARGAAEEGEGGEAASLEAVPEAETGLVSLPRVPLGLPPTSVPFDGPRRLELRPERPAQERTPDLDRHVALFEEAAAAAARLHADLLGLAAREADAARNGEDSRASLRQRDLDDALQRLDADLATARSTLAVAEDSCRAEIARSARRARAGIRAATRSAKGALNAKASEINRDTGPEGTERRRADAIATGADGRIAELRSAGNQAADALRTLSAEPAAAYPEGAEVSASPPSG